MDLYGSSACTGRLYGDRTGYAAVEKNMKFSQRFEITDMSIKEAIDTNWKANARTRIKGCDVVAVICGKHTNEATGVSAEVSIAQEEGIPYFLLHGRANEVCKKPRAAKTSDKIYNWTWNNLKVLINGGR